METRTPHRMGRPLLHLAAVAFATFACDRPASAPAPAQTPPVAAAAEDPRLTEMPQTLRDVRDLPDLYDEDVTDLTRRYAEKLERSTRTGRQFAMDRLIDLREKAAPEVVRVLNRAKDEASFAVAVNACEALQGIRSNSDPAVDALVEALHHPSGTARVAAGRALEAIGSPRALPALIAAFETTAPVERVAYLKAIGSVRSADADLYLVKTLEDSNATEAVRKAAAEGLALRPLATARDHWKRLAKSPPPVGDMIKIALAASGDPESTAFARLVSNQWGNPLCLPATLVLAKGGDLGPALSALRESNPEVRSKVGLATLREMIDTKALSAEARPAVIAALRARNDDPDKQTRVEALRLLKQLGEALPVERDLADLESGDAMAESAALDVLTDPQIAEPRSVPMLVKKLDAAKFARKHGYAQALGRVRAPEAASALERYLSGPTEFVDGIAFADYAALQLANLGAAGFDALERALRTQQLPARRLGLVRAVSGSKDPRAAERLEAIAGSADEHVEVRAEAIRSLPNLARNTAARVLKRLLSQEPDVALRRLLNAVLHEYY